MTRSLSLPVPTSSSISARLAVSYIDSPKTNQDSTKPVPRLTNLRASSYSALSLMSKKKFPEVRSTTVLLVRRDGHVAMAGDGQVTVGETVMKASAKKVRRLYNDKILAGFAGATGDAFSLLTRFEGKLEQYHGNLTANSG